jgi:hypothetical protein
MIQTQRSTVVGVFENTSDADRAISQLHAAGFTNDQIGVAGRNSNASETTEKGSHVLAGAATGAAVGAGAGGLVALGILAGVIPGIGPAIAAGTLGMVLANAASGAAIAGVAGALVGLGIPEEEAKHYEGEFKTGRTIVTVKDISGQAGDAWRILQSNGAYNHESPQATKRPGASSRTPASV